MNFFAPDFLCDERAAGQFGLVHLAGCITLGLARLKRGCPIPG